MILSALALSTLTACSNHPRIDRGQYWQRTDASESIYMRGPKAQQILNRDIARCVTDLKELERLGQLKATIPTDYQGRVLDPDELEMLDHDTPERDGHLFSEHFDYHDFESCMRNNGWERIKHVPYDVAKRAIETYEQVHIGFRSKSSSATLGTVYGAEEGTKSSGYNS